MAEHNTRQVGVEQYVSVKIVEFCSLCIINILGSLDRHHKVCRINIETLGLRDTNDGWLSLSRTGYIATYGDTSLNILFFIFSAHIIICLFVLDCS